MAEIGCPYKGLASFEDSDHDVQFFFGRERERKIICANLMASKLTVLYGDTGVGKSSVLRAGVARQLRSQGDALGVVVFDSWKDDPAAGLVDTLATAAGIEPRATLADTLEACSAKLAGDVYVILDGVEEYFLYHEGEEGPGTFFTEFPEAVKRPGLRASFLLAVREDALAKLDRFKASIPSLFGNYLRLAHLDREAAGSAIVGPIEQYNRLVEPSQQMEIEPALVDAVLDEVVAGKVDLGQTGRGTVQDRSRRDDRIEAPYLQLVMRRLWEAEAEAGSRTLRASTLADLGGAEEIVRAHLERALDSLTADQKDIASAVFNHLVTPSGTKIAHIVPDLARYAGVDEAALDPVLSTLTHERILRPAAADGGAPRYEIYHDVLGEAVLAWRVSHETERELAGEREAASRRQRRLLTALGAGGMLVAVMAGVTAYAVTQRGEAQSQARKAQARQLTASAVSALDSDPSLSLNLAAEAARLAPNGDVEAVLRTAYLADRRRAVLSADGPVTAARFSRDGRRILVASQDGGARIYDAATHELLRTLRHGAPLLDASFDDRGRLVVTAGEDGTARLWDLTSGRKRRTFRHGSPVRAVALDAARSVVATAGGRTVTLWSLDGKRIATIPWRKPVTGVAVDRNGRRIIVIGNDRLARLYDTADGRHITTFDQGGVITSAAFSDAARLLVTTGANETARIWRLRDGALLHELKGHRGSVLDATFSPGVSRVATVSADGTGRIWDVRSGALVASLVGHKGIVDAVAFSPDGNFIATGSDDRTARVSKADNGDARAWLDGHQDAIHGVAFSPDGTSVLTASDDGTARLWDPRTQPQLEVVSRSQGPVAGASYAGREAIAIAGPDNRVRVVRSDGHLLRTLGVRGVVRAVATSADGKTLAVADGSRITVFRPPGKNAEIALPGAAAVAVSPDDSAIAGGGADGIGRVWSIDGRLLHELEGHEGPITDIAFSPDGTRIATSSRDKTARVWDVATGRSIRALMGHRDDVTSVAFNPDGSVVLTASRDHDARLWSSETGALTQVLRGHFGNVADASFSPDGRWILTAGPATVLLWQPGVREPILPYGFGGHKPPLTSAVFDPTNRFVLSASADGTVRRSECTVCRDLDDMLVLARTQLAASGRKLTAEERERYGLD